MRPTAALRILCASALLCALLLVHGAPGAAAPKPVKIRLGTLAPKGSSYERTLKLMGEKWEQAPEGGAKLTIYPDGTQGSEADMVRLMRTNTLQAGLLTVVGLSMIEPGVSGLQNLPMMFHDYAEYDYVAERLRPLLQKRLEEKGFVVLFWGDAGWVHYFSREEIKLPDDMKKMKLFVWAGGTGQVDIMKKGGYNPVPLEPTDIIPGLQTGLIDAVTVPPIYALSAQLDTRAPHMLDLNWAILVGACVVTKETWDKIPESARKTMMEAADAAGNEVKGFSRKEADESVETMKKRGLQYHAITPEIESQWRTAVEKVYPDIRGNIVPADIFDEVQKLIAEYRSGGKKQ